MKKCDWFTCFEDTIKLGRQTPSYATATPGLPHKAMPQSLRTHCRGHVSSELGVGIGCK